jgi:hypothetical protein
MTSEEIKLLKYSKEDYKEHSWYIKVEQSWRIRTNKGIKDILQRKGIVKHKIA